MEDVDEGDEDDEDDEDDDDDDADEEEEGHWQGTPPGLATKLLLKKS